MSNEPHIGVSTESVEAARQRIAGDLVQTPCLKSTTLSEELGCELHIKFENLQFTASFKERGALNYLLARSDNRGVVAMSAGNHAQALAYHGKRQGIPVTIVMPRYTPNVKVAATRVFGAEVILHGAVFDETLAFTEKLANERNLDLVHPFDDPEVVSGQGTVALEMLEQIEDVDTILVPVGGGGLIGGVVTVAGSLGKKVIGVQMERFPGAYEHYRGNKAADSHGHSTVAEGIAVKAPGVLTGQLLNQVDDMLLVTEEAVEQAIFDLLEIEKTVAEGAGAAPLAALRSFPGLFKGQRIGMILSGGNIDMMTLSSVLQRGLVRSGRLVRMTVEIDDTPGALSDLTRVLGDMDSNIVDLQHQRTFGASSVKATLVDLELQMRGEEEIDRLIERLVEEGYEVKPS